MKVLVYATSKQGIQEGCSLDEACSHNKQGDEVLYLHCSSCLKGCIDNNLCNSTNCKFCQKMLRKRALKYLPAKCVHSVDEYVTPQLIQKVKNTPFSFETAKQIHDLQYNGIDIGYGALSTYISLTRNMNPTITPDIRKYFIYLLQQQVLLINVLENIITVFKPDLIVFHNGRFSQYKPLLGIAQKYNINFICTEAFLDANGLAKKDYFYNATAHNSIANFQHYKDFWDSFSNDSKRDEVAQSFYTNRRYGRYTCDKVYVKEQQYGLLPSDWDDNKENIVIFNSSEDEFSAVNREVDQFALFESQLTGIKTILDHYKADLSKKFYLRVHPNLAKVPYSYHMDLYNLNFDNLTVVPANSPISSYSLMDKANKIIVFGSTMGIESSYWKKPVICLAYGLYINMDVTYIPRTLSELWGLLEQKDLPTKYNENTLKYGLYYMSDKHESFTYIHNGIYKYKIWGRDLWIPRYCKFLGSSLLYLMLERLCLYICKRFTVSNFSFIPK